MSVSEDLINFDIIETQKENIQPLSSGRSAKTLATTFAPSLLTSNPGNTKTLNDALRAEYEAELAALEDSDDPLDIYDRYVKWTFAAYPSAQATVESQLRPLLERATKAFRSVGHYKNDPRYLRVWLHYIRFFSDAPRETFAYLSKHGIGEGLALFYEEFATWLETAKRWNQADEVYKLGIEREARPMERLARKYGEFQQRFQGRTLDAEEPTSPALPIVRPALAAKVDPFDSSAPRSSHVPMLRASNVNAASTNRGARSKLAVFSDKDEPTNEQKCISAERSNGWDNIGNIVDRKKENAIEARPWTGERLPNAKRATTAPKMAIFKDEVSLLRMYPCSFVYPRRTNCCLLWCLSL